MEQAGREVRIGADQIEALERELGSARQQATAGQQQAEECQGEVERAGTGG